MRTSGYVLLGFALCLNVVLIAVRRDQLPDRVASHFGFNGQPDDWMARDSFLLTQIGIQFAVTLFLLGIAKFSHLLPKQFFNMPNREYWLAEGRREETLRYSQGMLIWVAGLTSMFLCAVFSLVLEANRLGQGLDMKSFFTVLAVYLIALMTSVYWFSRKFCRTT